MDKADHMIVLIDRALSAARALREDRARLDEGAWKRLTDALLDARTLAGKKRGKEES